MDFKTQTTVRGETVLHARTTLVFYHRDGATVATLDKGKSLVVGRTTPADIEIPDPGLSRQHARFTWDDHGLWVEDLKSTNGTKKNGTKITRAQIAPVDEIEASIRVRAHPRDRLEARTPRDLEGARRGQGEWAGDEDVIPTSESSARVDVRGAPIRQPS